MAAATGSHVFRQSADGSLVVMLTLSCMSIGEVSRVPLYLKQSKFSIESELWIEKKVCLL